MRITKKFAGSNGIGKQVFCQCVPTEKTAELKKRLFREIDELERIFLNKVEANQNISFTVSAKALAFSAKLQMQVQQAPLLISESLASSKSSASGFYRVKRPIDAPTPWASRFDASNTPSISVHPKMSTDNSLYNAPSPYSGSKKETAANPRVGTKRTAEFLTSMESDQELSDDTPTSKRQHEFPAGADLDASSLLLNFFKSKRDVSDLDSDSNESLSETSNRNSETTNSCSTSMPYYSTDGGSLTATGSSSEEDRCLVPF